MLPKVNTYDIWPSVIPAGKISSMTVCANEPAFIFSEGEEFLLNIISVNIDGNYHNPDTERNFMARAVGGAIQFDFLFEGEGEHLIQLIKDEKVVYSFNVYSVNDDLYNLIPLKGDLHSHSCRSDGKCDPAIHAGHYREQGYDFVAITDHNRYYPGEEIDRFYEGVNTGLLRVYGEEVHSPGSSVHIVHVGGADSACSVYIQKTEEYEAQIERYMEKVPDNIPEIYKSRYAKAMWATDTIHSFGGIAIFAHPFWRPNASKAFNVCDDFAKILLKSGMFDAYELIGCMTQDDNNRSLALWSDLRIEGYNIRVVGSSDVHSIEKSSTFPNFFTVCFAKEKTNASIIESIKDGMSVAVEAVGYEYDRQYRCYAGHRLVSYSQFLLRYYFPRLQRLTAGAGVAMRDYVMENATAELINMHTELSEKFTARFFGRLSPLLPSDRLLLLENELRGIHAKESP